MKFLSIIIATIIFGLSILPCADKGSCAKMDILQIVDHDHDEEKQHSDHCSPLCVCSCCNTVTTHFEFKLLEEIKTFEFTHLVKTDLKLPIISTPFYSIWQPPQLV